MNEIGGEPVIRVGLMSARTVELTLGGAYKASTGEVLESGDYTASLDGRQVRLAGGRLTNAPKLSLAPVEFDSCRATVHGVTIGIEFHWERRESQQFQGALRFEPSNGKLTVINELPLESYLVSVISSEMSASCPAELLRAHAIVSRSWLLAQTRARYENPSDMVHEETPAPYGDGERMIRWYDRENHSDFDVCADDHCQRYQGISKAFSQEAFDALSATRGLVLVWGDEICDARYSKSCGGVTEVFGAAWADREVAYLTSVYDGPTESRPDFKMPLSVETNAREWITANPPAFCNTSSAELLARVLPGFDQETRDFYRWEVEYTNEELQEILFERTGISFGRVISMNALARGESGRIIQLQIDGEHRLVVLGKELVIRRSLSRSHLYSSAFVVSPVQGNAGDYPERFRLSGAGWGHGVGLCQIGAAVMADRGYTHKDILHHYFRGASLQTIY